MPDYDFSSLCDKEFESLVCDLLSEELGQQVERFKKGRDSGIDGRFHTSDGGATIIQCKHWLQSGIQKLEREMRTSEAAKVEKLAPRRFILATSLALTPNNKNSIVRAIDHESLSVGDVLGRDDLNGLLARHERVERAHFKLWLASTAVASAVLHAAVHGRSRFKLEEALGRVRFYWPTANHHAAVERLRQSRVVIVTGEPGVGKSTLAEHLLVNYSAQGYSPVIVEDDLGEAEGVWSEPDKQIFYFDDFLGRNVLLALEGSKDEHVARFIRRVAADPRKLFILTSRTNILNQGKRLSDIFRRDNLERRELELRIDTLSRFDRANILYNHLWFSGLPRELIAELYKDKKYMGVIKHRNYNPRVIAFICDPEKVEDGDPERYWLQVERTLENPKDIWSHVYDAQLTDEGRCLVSLVALNGSPIKEADLQAAFYEHPSLTVAARSPEFFASVRPLVGALLKRVTHEKEGFTSYDLFSPSIGDFVLGRYGTDGVVLARHFYALSTVLSLGSLRSLSTKGPVSVGAKRRTLELLSSWFTTSEYRKRTHEYLVRLGGMLMEDGDPLLVSEHILRFLAAETPTFQVPAVGFRLLRMLLGSSDCAEVRGLVCELATANADGLDRDDCMALRELAVALGGGDGAQIGGLVKDAAIAYFKHALGDDLESDGILNEFYDPSEEAEAAEAAWAYLTGQLEEIGVELDEDEVSDLVMSVDVDAAMERNRERALAEDYQDDHWRDHRDIRGEQIAEEARIHDLFDRNPLNEP